MKCVGGERGKKSLFCAENDNLSFFSLGSQPVEMDLLPAVSQSVSRNVFFIASQGLSGATLRAQPRGLSLSLFQSPLGFLLFFVSSPNLADASHLAALEQKVKNILCMLPRCQKPLAQDRQGNFEMLGNGSHPPKNSKKKKKKKEYMHKN